MSFFTPAACAATRHAFRLGTQSCRHPSILLKQHAVSILRARLVSGSAHSPPSKPATPARKRTTHVKSTVPKKTSPKDDSAKKASLILNSLRKPGQSPDAKLQVKSAHVRSAEVTHQNPIGNSATSQEDKILATLKDRMMTFNLPQAEKLRAQKMTAKELAAFTRNFEDRKKLLWPGIWTLLALAGTYGTLAYLDARAGIPGLDGSHHPERARAWQLTPAAIYKGFEAGWRSLDSLTIGIVVASIATQLLRRTSLGPIWGVMASITGQSTWKAFTYPLLNGSWTHLAVNMTALLCFLPGVVHYFDGDLFHTSAFLVSVPLITSYLSHFAYRFNLAKAFAMNIGANGAISAAFGVDCVAYAKDEMLVPAGLVFLLHQAYNRKIAINASRRVAFLFQMISLPLGVAYAYFDLKHHLWIPLVSEMSSIQ